MRENNQKKKKTKNKCKVNSIILRCISEVICFPSKTNHPKPIPSLYMTRKVRSKQLQDRQVLEKKVAGFTSYLILSSRPGSSAVVLVQKIGLKQKTKSVNTQKRKKTSCVLFLKITGIRFDKLSFRLRVVSLTTSLLTFQVVFPISRGSLQRLIRRFSDAHSYFLITTYIRTFFYKNVQPEIDQNLKNVLRTYPG